MKRSRFTETQIVSILNEAEAGLPVKEVCCKHGISSACYYQWKSKYGGLVQTGDGLARARPDGDRRALNAGGVETGPGVLEAVPALASAGPPVESKTGLPSLLPAGFEPSTNEKTASSARSFAVIRPTQPNQVWSADFMSDGLYSGLRFRTFNVLDDFKRESLAIEIDTSLPSRRLVRVFEQLKAERGLPDILRTDSGPEFLGEAFTDWCRYNGILLDYIEPGKLNQNAYIERFSRSYRQEVLDTWLFRDLDEVREISWAWMLEYNEERDHDSLNGRTPTEALHQAQSSTFEVST